MQKGILLVDLAHELIILGRDSWIHSLDPRSPESNWQRIEKEVLAAAPAAETRDRLQSEFGPDYQNLQPRTSWWSNPKDGVIGGRNYLSNPIAPCTSYMTRRCVKIRSGNFPMVAVVFPDESGMRHEFDRLDIDVGRVAGLYSVNSYRVMTHDGTRASSVMATVRHEAAHQSAFNSGAHSRINDTPRWITEGIGQMFEPAAMTDPRGATQLADRVNKESLQYLRQKVLATDAGRFVQTAMNLVSNDMMFKDEKQINEGYAVAWALMFYLAERQPKAFAKLLNETAGRRPFQTYQRRDRIADFERIVGMDTFEFSRKTLRYLESL